MEKLDITKLNTPKDIPIGTILVQHWLNSISYYKITKTSEKSITIIEVPKKSIDFDHDGGGTGTNYVMPDLDRLTQLDEEFGKLEKEIGFNPYSCSDKQWESIPDSLKQKVWNSNLWNNQSSFKEKRIMVKPAKNGGFYIPGVHRGSWCGNMMLWDGTKDSEYYGD